MNNKTKILKMIVRIIFLQNHSLKEIMIILFKYKTIIILMKYRIKVASNNINKYQTKMRTNRKYNKIENPNLKA
jgi:hypothetical protein